MHHPILPVAALILALSAGSALAEGDRPAQPTQAKSPAKAAPKGTTSQPPAAKPGAGSKAAPPKTELKAMGAPTVKESVMTPEQVKAQQAEWKKIEQQKLAERKAQREKFRALKAAYDKEGIKFRKGEKPNTYRVFAPAIAKAADPAQRKAAAKALAARLESQMEPVLKKQLTFEIYADEKVTQRVPF